MIEQQYETNLALAFDLIYRSETTERCNHCDVVCDISKLQPEFYRGRRTGNLICHNCASNPEYKKISK